MKRLLLVPALGVAALALSIPAQAQVARPGDLSAAVRASYADYARQPYFESRRAAYDNGYREGVKQGEKEGRKRSSYNYQNDRTWQRADKGYNRAYGDIDRYRQQFRAGYSDGYRAAYERYAGVYGNNRYPGGRAVPRPDPYGYPGGYGAPNRSPGRDPYYGSQGPYSNGRYGYDAAYPNGFNDGVEKGREDARKRRSYDPLRHSWYRSADRNYHREYGAKQQYQDLYRQGFREGYDRGYRELGFIR
jgi:flagellar biosynthesis/type III secretory pathway protein FliH